MAREGEATRTPTRAIARALLPVLPDARYVRVGGAGHMGPITHAEIARFVVTVERGERLVLAA